MDDRQAKAATRFVLATVFIYAIGFGIIMPVLPKLVVTLGDVSLSEATRIGGWLILTYALFQFLFGPLIGNLSDRFGRRPILLLSMAGFGIDYAVMGFAPTLAWLFAGRMIAGTFGAAFSTAYATLSDIYGEDDRARVFGLIGAAFGIGFIVGPAIGGLIGELGTRLPFFVASGLALANLVYGFFVFPETHARENRRPFRLARANPLGALLKLRHVPGILPMAGVFLLWTTAINVYPSVWAYFTQLRFGWSEGLVGLSLAWVGLLMALVQALAIGPLVKRFGERRAAMIGIVSGTAGFLLIAVVSVGWATYVIMAVTALHALSGPSLIALMSRRAPADMQGELQGFNSSLTALAAIAAPLVFNPSLAYFTSPDAPMRFAGAPFVISTAVGTLALLVLICTRHVRAPTPG
ncbi:MAG: TCR/Tet family MFS transporter [Pseudomonadota bacterium]